MYGVARIGDSAYIFGGYDGIQDVDDVARLTLVDRCPEDKPNCEDFEKESVKEWFDVGKLLQELFS